MMSNAPNASGLSGMQLLKQRLTLIMGAETPKSLGAPARLALRLLAVALLPLLPTLAYSKKGPVESDTTVPTMLDPYRSYFA